MHEKLKTLLEQIELDKSMYEYFKSGNLDKIVGNTNKDAYTFFITLERNLPIDVYTVFCDKLKLKYKGYKIKLDLNVVNNECIGDYFNYFIDQYSKESPLLKMYKDSVCDCDGCEIKLEISNRAEEMKFDTIKRKMIKELRKAGFKEASFDIKIDSTKSKEIQAEINKERETHSKVSVKRTEPKVIFGDEIRSKVTGISDIISEENNVCIDALVFDVDYFESPKTPFKIITLKVTDKVDSMYCKIFTKDEMLYKDLKKKIQIGKYYKFRGYTKNDNFAGEIVLNVRDVNKSNTKEVDIKDDAEEKRIELHAHTFMSQMDGLIKPNNLISIASKMGHKAVAVTDHNSVQSYPDLFHTVTAMNKNLKEGEEPFKVIYGAELVMIDDTIEVVKKPTNGDILENTYIVFDFETTGFNAGGGDQIIEVGAVKIKNGEVLSKFSKLIDPKRKLVRKITEITGITDDMLKGMPSEEEVIKEFKDYIKDLPLVAHNAKFDMSFLEMAYKKYGLGEVNNTVIDTLELSRVLDSNYARHNLSALVKRYDVEFDENNHHRADYDAEATAQVLMKMLKKLHDQNIEKLTDFEKLIGREEILKFGKQYHINVLAKNKKGLKNLFKLISLASTKYLYKTPRIPRSEISNLREGLLIGSSCYESEVFKEATSKSEEELINVVSFYDYVEVQPIKLYDHLIQSGSFASYKELEDHLIKIMKVAEDCGKLLVATGDVHHLTEEDKIYRQIIVNQKVPGGGRHPLSRKGITDIPSAHFRTTNEMLEGFNFIDDKLKRKIVIENPNKLADMIDIIEVIIDTKGVPFSPKIENSEEIVKKIVYDKAHELYSENLPDLVKDRIEKELEGIIGGGFDVIYLISQKLVKKSNDEGYLVGSRGSVGSSFVATLMGITEVNPLPAHYRCPECGESIFEKDGKTLGSIYSSGFDLPDMKCSKCDIMMVKEGQDMPFATFLGFNADKVPDIDLNFSGDYQSKAHEYTKELFGEDYVLRAGTIGTVAAKTAYGFVKGYCEDKGILMRNAEVERLALGCTGVKRTTGQHPGGIVVIPDYMDAFDFTPYQYPADDPNSAWKTTHFDYHAIEENILKLDILGHDDPTLLKVLQDLTGVDIMKIPFDDQKVMGIFRSPEPLGITSEEINCPTGTLGVPEFGTNFTINMLVDTKPTTFAELIKLSGLSHGTDVWLGNAQELIKNNVCDFKEVIGCRDDIMVYLMYNGLKPKDAFKIMEFVRKGKASKDEQKWQEFKKIMEDAGIVDWYIDSCYKIKYMFPKAHAAAYVMSAFRIAWFKVHYALEYYLGYFSVRCSDFDIETMIAGKDTIRRKIMEISNKGKEASNKELDTQEVLKIALEATARGIEFENVDLSKSDSSYFVKGSHDKALVPPFSSIDGLGTTVAKKIVEEREKAPFLSIEDLQKRCKVSSTLIEKMRKMKMLDDLDESSQLSLF